MSKVLLVDSYDSYTYNLHQLVLDVVPTAEIVIIRNDQLDCGELDEVVAAFDCIIIGPGPGDPRNAKDIGFLLKLFSYDIPILGVCLGFQLICLNEGAEIKRLKNVKHGQVSSLHINPSEMYSRPNAIKVTQYHSLYADISGTSSLEELAWVDDDCDNGHVTMAVRHISRPFVGVQYHPESACSENGSELIAKFLELAAAWNACRDRQQSELCQRIKHYSVRPQPLAQPSMPTGRVEWRELDFVLPTDRIADLLKVRQSDVQDFILLDAASEPSRYSILAVLSGVEERLSYSVGQTSWQFGAKVMDADKRNPSVWHFVANLMQARKTTVGPKASPFWGGLTGYFSYESGVESQNVKPVPTDDPQLDINLVFVEKSIVVDHARGRMYVQSIKSLVQNTATDDCHWIDSMCALLDEALRTPPSSPPTSRKHESINVTLPNKATYLENRSRAKQYLAEGQSYELCLTAQTKIVCPKRHPWELYLELRKRNPSPFAAYMHLEGVHLLSSSPERFLSWDRHGSCQLRPIKGTVRKSANMTRDKAAEILRDPKEVAENLMIVDLIRHDLHQIASNVSVPTLMQVEEYHTVYQLVSVITGQYESPYTGFDILSRSLPPGSMTGAPKKRSVELLQQLEGRRRGLYSGVCGYLSVCGGGDWSVIIRSAFRHASKNTSENGTDTWWIGAGGAITALSNPGAEWDEMVTKLQSTLPCFGSAVS